MEWTSCHLILLQKFKGFKGSSRTLIRTEVITAENRKQFFKRRIWSKIESVMLLKELTWLEMNTEVNYLFLFFITDFTDFTFFRCNHKYYLFNVLVGTYEKKKLWNGRESWSLLALCRFSLGICIYSFLSSLIFKSIIMSHHVSNIGRIWKVFGILSAVTVVEVF
jgi:hypothetical protein